MKNIESILNREPKKGSAGNKGVSTHIPSGCDRKIIRNTSKTSPGKEAKREKGAA